MKKYLQFIKIEHTLFSLPIVFSGALLAMKLSPPAAPPTFKVFFLVFLAAAGARSAGFALNRILDKDIDAKNPRTSGREMPSGKITPAGAWIFAAVSAAIYFSAAAGLSKICFLLSPIPLLLFLIYPFLKRFTMWAHLGLGVAWGVAPIGGWLAVNDSLSPFSNLAPVLIFAGFCVLWVAGFDVIYALLDEDSDRANGLYSMPAKLGGKDAIIISEIIHFCSFLALGSVVVYFLPGTAAYLLLAASGILLCLSHWKIVSSPLTPAVIDFAFFKINAVLGFLVFFIVLSGFLKP